MDGEVIQSHTHTISTVCGSLIVTIGFEGDTIGTLRTEWDWDNKYIPKPKCNDIWLDMITDMVRGKKVSTALKVFNGPICRYATDCLMDDAIGVSKMGCRDAIGSLIRMYGPKSDD